MEDDVRTLELLDHVVDVVPRVDHLLDVVGELLEDRPERELSSAGEEVWAGRLDKLQRAYDQLQLSLKKAKPAVTSACPPHPAGAEGAH